jgi:hypothetical protein
MDRKEIIAKKQQYVYPAVANYFAEPLPLERGEMQHVWDVEGSGISISFGGIVTVGVGHCNPRITGPQKKQIDKLGHTSTLYPHADDGGAGGEDRADYAGAAGEEFFHELGGRRRTRRRSIRRGCIRGTWRLLRCATRIAGGRR